MLFSHGSLGLAFSWWVTVVGISSGVVERDRILRNHLRDERGVFDVAPSGCCVLSLN